MPHSRSAVSHSNCPPRIGVGQSEKSARISCELNQGLALAGRERVLACSGLNVGSEPPWRPDLSLARESTQRTQRQGGVSLWFLEAVMSGNLRRRNTRAGDRFRCSPLVSHSPASFNPAGHPNTSAPGWCLLLARLACNAAVLGGFNQGRSSWLRSAAPFVVGHQPFHNPWPK
mgnify:CR=1 FL=1